MCYPWKQSPCLHTSTADIRCCGWSSSSGGTLEEHSRFHDASPGIKDDPLLAAMQSVVLGWAVWDRSRLFEARTDEVGLLGGANQQGGDRWMLEAHVSGPLRLQPELYAQRAWGGVVVLVRKPGVGLWPYRYVPYCHGIKVRPSARFPPDLSRPDGSLIEDWMFLTTH